MMGTTRKLQDLYARFDAMISGRVPMTTYEAAEFKRELRAVMAEVGLMELGIANDTFEAAVKAEQQSQLPPSNVVPIDIGGGIDPKVVSLTKVRLDRIIAGMLARPTTDGGAS
ncbi:hypothetical protein [Bradyrhizobium sp. BR 10289]|uniref:hypothetical protein n=1 Tax=Bradyrhizobium sp. BR 10289 TaxID=2749993 RepID=UPI001C6468FD|nr:hypothetical protein [Bradyrhizobium sp. BR 10289]MBW7968149.1 hypothetical protein [Bradyrhizobium sp. BR 10289]